MSFKIIGQSSNPLGGYFFAQLPDSTYLAGRTQERARHFPSLQDVYDAFYHDAVEGSHWAWNLCYEAQFLMNENGS